MEYNGRDYFSYLAAFPPTDSELNGKIHEDIAKKHKEKLKKTIKTSDSESSSSEEESRECIAWESKKGKLTTSFKKTTSIALVETSFAETFTPVSPTETSASVGSAKTFTPIVDVAFIENSNVSINLAKKLTPVDSAAVLVETHAPVTSVQTSASISLVSTIASSTKSSLSIPLKEVYENKTSNNNDNNLARIQVEAPVQTEHTKYVIEGNTKNSDKLSNHILHKKVSYSKTMSSSSNSQSAMSSTSAAASAAAKTVNAETAAEAAARAYAAKTKLKEESSFDEIVKFFI